MTDSNPAQRTLARTADVFGGVVLGIASAVIVGWLFDVGFLKSLLPGSVDMKFNTALGLFLGVLALRGASRCRSERCRMVGRVCAVLIACLGAVTLIEYAFGWEAGLDNLFFRETADIRYAGRMAPHTAASFFPLGLAFLCSSGHRRWQRRCSHTMLTCVALIALAALAGHLYGAFNLYGLSQFTGMATHTALAFLALCAGLFCAQQLDGPRSVFFSDTSGGVTARRLLPAAILVPLLLGWVRVRGQDIGLYDTATGVALLVTASMLVFAVLIGLTARSLHGLDLIRREAQEARDHTMAELQRALDEVRTLQGLLPMCAWCKKIRDDGGLWSEVATYISRHTDADVSHDICPECASVHFPKSK